jgi:PIN domain nuclease of toxin-antitoxin system
VRLLLDTQPFLWWIADDGRLPPRPRVSIADGANEVFVSVVSVWEIVVKAGLGRLEVPDPIDRFVMSQLEANGFLALPVTMRHALGLASLPDAHDDPFDRVLVAQAVAEDLTLVTGDRAFADYPVTTTW